MNPAPLSMERCRHETSASLQVKRERGFNENLGKLSMCLPNLPGHRSLMSESLSGNLEIKGKAGLLLGGESKESSSWIGINLSYQSLLGSVPGASHEPDVKENLFAVIASSDSKVS